MNPALEAYFGNPEGLFRLASALERTSDQLWTLRKTLAAQVTGLVPAQWDGRASAAFEKDWEERSNSMYQVAEMARRMKEAITKLGTALQNAKAMFVTGEEIAASNGMWIVETGVGFAVVNPNQPFGAAAQVVAQGQVTGAWAAANAAWLEAHAELAIDTVSMLGPLKDISLGLVRAVDDVARFGLAAADFANRFSPERWWSDPGGAVEDAKSTAKSVGNTLSSLGEKAWTVLKISGELSPEMAQIDPEYFQRRSQEVGQAINDEVEKIVDRPGAYLSTTVEIGAGLLGPGKIAKALEGRFAAEALDAAALERRAAAVDAVAGNPGDRIGQLGAAGEASRMRALAQEGEVAVDLNEMPSVGRAANFPLVDNMSGSGFESVKVKMGATYDPVVSDAGLRAYRNDFQSLLDEGRTQRAADALTSTQNAGRIEELQASGAWPRDLPTNATSQDVAAYIRDNGRLAIPSDHVPQVQDYLRTDVARFPENYGLPAGTAPTQAQVDSLVGRVTSNGIDSATVSQMVPDVLPPGGVATPTFPTSPPTGSVVPLVTPIIPSTINPPPSPAPAPG
jgi:uncharacterized protein YukE